MAICDWPKQFDIFSIMLIVCIVQLSSEWIGRLQSWLILFQYIIFAGTILKLYIYHNYKLRALCSFVLLLLVFIFLL